VHTRLLTLLLLAACGDKAADDTADSSTAEPSPFETDDDGDGLSEADGDCDDDNATISPGAEELCDGVDNDCDGTIDDGAGDLRTFYWDHDGDGTGETPVEACALPEGAAENDGDCDDLDAAINPGADEVCDGLDNDCDGAVDDEDDSLDRSTHSDWYRDADADGYGDPATLVGRSCEALPGTVADSTDCDDAEPAVNPGQAEVCDVVGIDEDCDGLVNDEDDSIYVASQTLWFPDSDGDGFGDQETAALPLCIDPSTEELAYVDDGTDCADDDAVTHPGAPEVCSDGVVNDCDGTPEAAAEACAWNTDLDATHASTVISPEENDFFSWFAAAGDLDGDGTEDLVITSSWSTEGDGYGRAYVLEGPITASALDAGDGHVIEGLSDEDSTDTFGVDPVVVDVDGDGYADLFAGAPGVDIDSNSNVGGAFLLLGPLTSGTTAELAAGSVVGIDANAAFGAATAVVGDQDGDGVADLLVSDSYGGSSRHGEVYLISGEDMTEGTVLDHSSAAIATFTGESSYDFAGSTGSMASLSDVDGDGVGDVIIGCGRAEVGEDSEGKAYVFHGPVSGDWSLADADAVLSDSTDGTDGLGYTLLGGFDLDGDGTEDLAIGATYSEHHADNAGAVYVQAGPITADADLGSTALATFTGAEDDYLGGEMDHGDFDGDGQVDLLLGVGYRSQTGNSAGYSGNTQAVFLSLGPASGALTTADLTRLGAAVSDPDDVSFGLGVVSLGDQDGSGADVVGVADRGEAEDSWFLFTTPQY
jgi:hypothetical protein